MKTTKEDTAIQLAEFEAFVTKYKKLVITVCYSFVRNYFTAEDLSQEVFISAYKNFAAFDGKNEKGWIITIAANKCKDYLKKSETRMNTSSYEIMDDSVVSQAPSPEEQTIDNEVREKFTYLIQSLNDPYKTALRLNILEGIPTQEIARIKNVPKKTVETWCYRGKKIVREKWREEYFHE